ncbi:emp24/gp25L/p24 family/GOLD-domain-containing protein [Mucor mucedo]|nr:emp24/gp25L/p24 family/GOLD-domain-containing protein [Mucor mucedo]KAI7877296.1 emp24/gp25L/p24 family/GOLD-domain-containing protein [Mucor mucedo]
MNRLLLAITALLLIIQHVYAMTIDIDAGEKECYYEELDVGERLTLSYEVGEGGKLDVDFWLTDPTGATVISTVRTTSDVHTYNARFEGKHTYCFSNEFSNVSDKKLSFNVHENFQKVHDSVKESTDPLDKEIAELAESIFAVKAQQEYIVFRERQHRDTAESTNSRVKWWSTAQLGLLISVCLWQVYYLKRFFEVKRTV